MTVNSIDRQVEIENMLIEPVYASAKVLGTQLSYEPVVYPSGRSGVQAESKTEVTITCDFDVQGRGHETIGGHMFKSEAEYTITFAVPERSPGRDVHGRIKQAISSLQNHYSIEFCNNVEQLYFEDVSWTTSIDTTSRTEYILTISMRFYDYPNREAS